MIVAAAKRRFTVMGQVARPGSYEFSDGDGLNLLPAIAMAGGFTRLASLNKVTVRREETGKIFNLTVDTKALSTAKNQIQFKVLPGDIIDVGERVF
jgi:polysaccharide export outer membrane protein